MKETTKKLNLPEKEIINLYCNKKLSTIKIADIYNCCSRTISNILKRNNIQHRSISDALKLTVDIPTEEIINLYCNKRFTLSKIANIYNCSSTCIKNLLEDNDIKIRSKSEAAIISRGLNLPEKEIINLYIGWVSITDIAIIYNCTPGPIYDIIKNNNIKLRSKSEAKLGWDINLHKYKIINLYIKDKLDIINISYIYNCNPATIVKLLKNNNIQIRLSSEIIKDIVNDPKWKKKQKEGANKDQPRICIKCGHDFIGKPTSLYCPECNPNEYCYKWDEDCKERNREKYNRECFFCGKLEEKIKHCSHHADYNKNQGCDDTPDWKLVPLCNKCHSMTGGGKEKREIWEARILYLHNEYWNNIQIK